MEYLYQVVAVSIKNDKHEEKKSFSKNPLSKVKYDVSRSCLSTPISYLWTINQPSIVQMASNFRVHSHMTNDVCIMPCQFRLKFSENSCKNSNLRVPLICETSIDRTKIASQHHVKRVMVHHIVTRPQSTIWTSPKSFKHYSQTLVKPHSLTKAYKIHN